MRLRYRYVAYGAGRTAMDQIQQMHHVMHQLMSRSAAAGAGAWQPPTDVYETDDAVVVRAELAGVREDEIQITLFSDHLAVAGTRHNPTPPHAAAYHVAGILYGDFRLEIPMMASVDRDAVEASYDDGLLTVILPKVKKNVEPVSVTVQSRGAQDESNAIQPGVGGLKE